MAIKHLTSGRWHWGPDFVGYTVEVYEAGTSTQKTTYSDSDLTVSNTWPVTLDANGAGQIWFDGAAKVIVKTPLGSVYETDDEINNDAGEWCGTAGGTGDAITLTPSPAITAYSVGKRYIFLTSAANTGAVTVAISGLTAKNVTKFGATALVANDIPSGAIVSVVYDGTRFQIDRVNLVAAANTFTAKNTFTGNVVFSKGADVASVAALTLGTDGNYFDITGTTAITSISTIGVGTVIRLHFDAALTLTYHATDLVLPGGANITTAAGDEAEFIEYAAGDWRCTVYTKADGSTLRALTSGTPIATTSGTSHDWTGIPSWVTKITIPISGLRTNGTSIPMIQIGDSGGVEATGYSGSTATMVAGSTVASNHSTGFLLEGDHAAAVVFHGTATLTLLDAATNTWSFEVSVGRSNSASVCTGGGSKALSATLDRIRLTTVNGTDAFDAGSVNILYE